MSLPRAVTGPRLEPIADALTPAPAARPALVRKIEGSIIEDTSLIPWIVSFLNAGSFFLGPSPNGFLTPGRSFLGRRLIRSTPKSRAPVGNARPNSRPSRTPSPAWPIRSCLGSAGLGVAGVVGVAPVSAVAGIGGGSWISRSASS